MCVSAVAAHLLAMAEEPSAAKGCSICIKLWCQEQRTRGVSPHCAADTDFMVEATPLLPGRMAPGEASGSRSAEVSVLVDNDDMEEEDIGEPWAWPCRLCDGVHGVIQRI